MEKKNEMKKGSSIKPLPPNSQPTISTKHSYPRNPTMETDHGSSRISTKVQLFLMIIITCLMPQFKGGLGIRFEIKEEEECLSQNVDYDDATLHVAFVVIKADAPWRYGHEGVDLAIKGPSGELIHDFHDKTSDKYDFKAKKSGLYKFCFTNKSPFHETIHFDVHVGHFVYYDQHAKDEHFNPMLEQISKLEEALYNIQFEQHWLEAQTDRQALVNEAMSQRAVYKAIFESLMLIGASFFQIYLLRLLFERKLGTSRV